MTEGKVVVITGGTRGTGRVLTDTFRKEGWHVAVLARNLPADTVSRGNYLFQSADVTQPDMLERAAERVVQQWGRIDVWINNAGVGKLIPFGQSGGKEWAEVFNVNFWGAVHGSRVAANAMLAEGRGGSVISISSLAGIQACPNHSAYSTAKAAVIALTRSLAVEYADKNVRFNAVAPGPIDTDGFRAAGGDAEKRALSIPTRSMVKPEEIADACLFLAKPMASLTGHTLVIDGGSAAVGCYANFKR